MYMNKLPLQSMVLCKYKTYLEICVKYTKAGENFKDKIKAMTRMSRDDVGSVGMESSISNKVSKDMTKENKEDQQGKQAHGKSG